jgi:RNA recognition motif-containing protein
MQVLMSRRSVSQSSSDDDRRSSASTTLHLRKIMCRNLNFATTDKSLFDFFSQFGELNNVCVCLVPLSDRGRFASPARQTASPRAMASLSIAPSSKPQQLSVLPRITLTAVSSSASWLRRVPTHSRVLQAHTRSHLGAQRPRQS